MNIIQAVEGLPAEELIDVLFAGDRASGTADEWQEWTVGQILSADYERMIGIIEWRTKPAFPSANEKKLRECASCLLSVVQDVMPQVGKVALQDYEKLNRGLMLAKELGLTREESDK